MQKLAVMFVICMFLLSLFSLASALDLYGSTDVNVNSDSDSRNNLGVVIGSDVEIDSDITVENNGSSSIVVLSNGDQFRVEITSQEARESAEASLEVKDCSNCTVELSEERSNGEMVAVYEVSTYKPAKVFWLFNANMEVEAHIDAQTGTVISVEKPWWAFVATQTSTSANANVNASN